MPRAVPLLVALVSLAAASPAAEQPSFSATYTVAFSADWSSDTHPDAYPAGAHFSPPIGGTHDDSVAFWAAGELASDGIEAMAELGNPNPLMMLVEQAIEDGDAGAVISGPSNIPSPGSWQTDVTITQDHPLVTLTTMIAPSPDWFVGVAGLPLFVGGAWVDELTVELSPYDAGTEEGTGFSLFNPPTSPPEPIAPITTGGLANGVPLGTFTFTRTDADAVWQDLGAGLAGTNGVPRLEATGTLAGGTPIGLDLAGALGSAPTTLVLGLSALNAPFKGGTLVPAPTLLLAGLLTSPAGTLSLSGTVPAGLPAGVPLFFQHWQADPAGVKGFAASNAVCGTTP